MLLFTRHPRYVMAQAGILGTISKDGEDDLRDFDGSIVVAPEQVIQWLRDKFPNPISRTEARRKEQNDIYYELVREGLVNALVHRDYQIKQAKIQTYGDAGENRNPKPWEADGASNLKTVTGIQCSNVQPKSETSCCFQYHAVGRGTRVGASLHAGSRSASRFTSPKLCVE